MRELRPVWALVGSAMRAAEARIHDPSRGKVNKTGAVYTLKREYLGQYFTVNEYKVASLNRV